MTDTILQYVQTKILYPCLILDPPSENLGISVVIPCFNEKDITSTIMNLAQCDKPSMDVEIVISIYGHIDAPEEIKNQNQKTFEELEMLSDLPDWMKVHGILNNNFPNHKAGIGLSRKVGLDESLVRLLFARQEIGDSKGILVNFDSDSRCDDDFFTDLEDAYFIKEVDSTHCYFEYNHFENKEDDSKSRKTDTNELNMRYLIEMLKSANFKYQSYSLGTCMASTLEAYAAVGGMPDHPTKSDFYFGHRLMNYGIHQELKHTRIFLNGVIKEHHLYVGNINDGVDIEEPSEFLTYHPEAFDGLSELATSLPDSYEQETFTNIKNPTMIAFLENQKGEVKLKMLMNRSADYQEFATQFWDWFDIDYVIKFLDYYSENGKSKLPIIDAVKLAFIKDERLPKSNNVQDLLTYLRSRTWK